MCDFPFATFSTIYKMAFIKVLFWIILVSWPILLDFAFLIYTDISEKYFLVIIKDSTFSYLRH